MWTRLWRSGVLTVVLLATCQAWGQTALNWETNLEHARQQAAASGRLVLVHFSAPWCTACRKMEQEVLSQPTVQATINADYVPVRLNVDHNRILAQQYGVRSLPTDIVITPDGRLLERHPGFMEAHQYVARLRQIAASARRAPVAMSPPRPTGPLPVTAQVPPGGASGAASAGPTLSLAGRPMGQQPLGPAGPSLNERPPSQPTSRGGMGSVAQGSPEVAPAGRGPTDFHRYAAPGTRIQPPTSTQPPTPAQGPAHWQGPTVNQTGAPAGVADQTPPMRSAPPKLIGPRAPYEPAQAPTTPEPSQPAPAEATMAAVASQAVRPTDPGSSPFALDGMCPVELVENKVWKFGNIRWGANHRGCTYLFSGPEQQKRFLADPDRYSPVASGIDIVLATTTGKVVPGKREHGVFFENRVYLFASEDSLATFSAEPRRYLKQLEVLTQASRGAAYR